MNQTEVLDAIQAYLTSIGKAHPTLDSGNSLISPSQFVTALSTGYNALPKNGSAGQKSGGVPTNPWAETKTSTKAAAATADANADTTGVDLEQLPVFKEFIDKIEKSGYFKNVEEGSDEYKKRYDKALAKFRTKYEKQQLSKQEKNAAPSQSTAEKEAEAVAFKNRGNDCLKKSEFDQALEYYKQAINSSSDGPASHIFFANAAAALIHLERYEEAAEMCGMSIAVKDDYAKAHTRLGFAKIHMGDPQGAITNLERSLELSPGNALTQQHLTKARGMVGGGSVSGGAPGGMGGMGGGMPGGGGMPDLASMMASLGGGAGGGAGGMPGGMGGMMQQMMSNPGFMQQAQQMMQNPQMMQMAQSMMQDPNAMQQAQQMMQDPNAMQQAMNMMGGAPGAGGGAGGPDLSAMMAAMGGGGGGGGGGGDDDFNVDDAEDVN